MKDRYFYRGWYITRAEDGTWTATHRDHAEGDERLIPGCRTPNSAAVAIDDFYRRRRRTLAVRRDAAAPPSPPGEQGAKSDKEGRDAR